MKDIFIIVLLATLLSSCGQVTVSPTATNMPPTETYTPPPTETPSLTPSATLTFTPTLSLTPDPSLQEYHVISDASWKFTRDPDDGWMNLAFDDSSWQAVAERQNSTIPGSQAIAIWDYPYVFKQNDTLYFRKVFEVQAMPARARLVVVVDDDIQVYLNGNLIIDDHEAAAWLWELDVRPWLIPGQNILAYRAVDTGEGAAEVVSDLGLCPNLTDRYTPFIDMSKSNTPISGPIFIGAVDASCDSGIAEIAYRIDGGEWKVIEPNAPVNLPEGKHFVEVRVKDGDGKQVRDSWQFEVVK
jgi:hypothetical protein